MAIMLQKGQRISLRKEDNYPLENFCVGANWGAMNFDARVGMVKNSVSSNDSSGMDRVRGILGAGFRAITTKPIDLDLSAQLLDEHKKVVSQVYFLKKRAKGVRLSGDDMQGDFRGNDGIDNEVISINLKELDSKICYITVILNSFNNIDFSDLPFASVRIYEGTSRVVEKLHAQFKIDNDSTFAGSKGLILGALYKKDNAWKFNTIGQPVPEHELGDIVERAITLL